MTPGRFNDSLAMVNYIEQGTVGMSMSVNYNIQYVKPVINLKEGSINAGDGTMSNPYRIE